MLDKLVDLQDNPGVEGLVEGGRHLRNMSDMSVTEETSQELRGRSKEVAPPNMLDMSVTEETSQELRGRSKEVAPPNMSDMSVTEETSQELRSPLKEEALDEHVGHVGDKTQIWRVSGHVDHVGGPGKGVTHVGPGYAAPLVYRGKLEYEAARGIWRPVQCKSCQAAGHRDRVVAWPLCRCGSGIPRGSSQLCRPPRRCSCRIPQS